MESTRRQTFGLAHACGLSIATYSPGDGVTRYRVFTRRDGEGEADYFAGQKGEGHGLYTALGLAELRVWLAGYAAGPGGVEQ